MPRGAQKRFDYGSLLMQPLESDILGADCFLAFAIFLKFLKVCEYYPTLCFIHIAFSSICFGSIFKYAQLFIILPE